MLPMMRRFASQPTLAVLVLAACSSGTTSVHRDADGGGSSMPPLVPDAGGIVLKSLDLGATCDAGRSVQSDGAALLVRDPETLSRFSLARVLRQIISTAGATITPAELLQRLFDTENTTAAGVFADNVHCDDPDNHAFAEAKAVDCPRAEGGLAQSAGLLLPDDPDYFVPVALVNRFDLMPSDLSTCGEYRIVFAKWSGRTLPENRAFLIFEAALANPMRTLGACRTVAELWASLESSSSPAGRADRIEKFYFTGQDGFAPAIHANHYGLNPFNCSYSGRCGQVRLGQGMQAPWEFRQFRLENPLPAVSSAPLHFAPTPDTASFDPLLFDPAVTMQAGDIFRAFFSAQFPALTDHDVGHIRTESLPEYETGESAIEGPAQPNYVARVVESRGGALFTERIAASLQAQGLPACPSDDPITPSSVLQRGAALTCAGCHAPERVLTPDRKIGCGQVWPKSLGLSHIDEQGALSEALTTVFLPHRAAVLGTYLQACDLAEVIKNLQPVTEQSTGECFPAGTPITMADGSRKPIEQIVAGEAVMTFDEPARSLVAGNVSSTVVRPHTDSLIVINGSLFATPNHPFYTSRGWVRAESLHMGDGLIEARDLDPTGSVRLEVEPGSVRQLMMVPGSVVTYNLEIAVHHNYFAGGLLVHDRP